MEEERDDQSKKEICPEMTEILSNNSWSIKYSNKDNILYLYATNYHCEPLRLSEKQWGEISQVFKAKGTQTNSSPEVQEIQTPHKPFTSISKKPVNNWSISVFQVALIILITLFLILYYYQKQRSDDRFKYLDGRAVPYSDTKFGIIDSKEGKLYFFVEEENKADKYWSEISPKGGIHYYDLD